MGKHEPDQAPGGVPVLTVGHSNRTLEDFVAILKAHGVERLVDVRRHPGSRRHPHFARKALEQGLSAANISYVHEPDLGGRRKPHPDSAHTAWENEQFRGYADHMATSEFRAALHRACAWAEQQCVCVMCAEAHFSRCHRRLLADAIVVAGHPVVHVLDAQRIESHVLHPALRIAPDGRLLYPAADQLELFEGDPWHTG
jgi:uncharacterized protein (DUF488 family)